MGYGKRIDTLCSLLVTSDTFADVGCDHGYCTEYVLKNKVCKRAIFSDISKGSLQKAQTLLANFVENGVAIPVLGDGFFGVPNDVEQVLIAGMGGSEMVSILSDEKYGFIPKRFVLQPMHDAEKLRKYLLENGACILRDFTFFDGKYYDVIVGEYPKAAEMCCEYTDAELEFGKDNLRERGDAFLQRIQKLLKDTEKYLTRENLQEESRLQLLQRKERLQGVLSGAIK